MRNHLVIHGLRFFCSILITPYVCRAGDCEIAVDILFLDNLFHCTDVSDFEFGKFGGGFYAMSFDIGRNVSV